MTLDSDVGSYYCLSLIHGYRGHLVQAIIGYAVYNRPRLLHGISAQNWETGLSNLSTLWGEPG